LIATVVDIEAYCAAGSSFDRTLAEPGEPLSDC
jgi:hypothetical protein